MCFSGNVKIMLNSFQKPKAGLQVVSPKKISWHSSISCIRQVRCLHVPVPPCSSPAPAYWSMGDKAVKMSIHCLLSKIPLFPPSMPPWGLCFPPQCMLGCYLIKLTDWSRIQSQLPSFLLQTSSTPSLVWCHWVFFQLDELLSRKPSFCFQKQK